MRVDLRKSLFILPNAFTLSSVFCGFYAIVLLAGDVGAEVVQRAVLLVLFAMLFDAVDGRVARLTRTQSAIGVQLDSLADAISFGVAPGLLVHRWSLHVLGMSGVVVAFAYVAAGVVRLARFNVMTTDTTGRPHRPGRYILGLPIPAAAGILVSLVAANEALGAQLPALPWVMAAVVLALAFFMVSTVRFRSFKDLRWSWRTAVSLLLTVGSTVFVAVRVHVSVAVAWLLGAYVALGVLESLLGFGRRLGRRGGRGEEDGPVASEPADQEPTGREPA